MDERSTQRQEEAHPWLIQSVVRSLALLELVAKQGSGCNAKWISYVSGIKLSTCYHLLNTLVSTGYLQKDAHSQEYSLTGKVAYLNNCYQRQQIIPKPLKVLTQSLVQNTGETAYLATWMDGEVSICYIAEGTRDVKVDALYAGYKEHAFVRALGKAVLAFLPETDLAHYYQMHPPLPCTPYSHITWDEILADFQQIRVQGFALDEQEFKLSICCIGAPIFQQDASLWGSLSISMPTTRFNRELTTFVQGQALTASLNLGYSPKGNNG